MSYQTVLIDGDLVVYRAACAVEKETRWDDGVWTYTADERDGIKVLNNKIAEILKNTKAKDYILCFSDDEHNFRKDVLPSYKGNRAEVRRPLLLKTLRNHCMLEMKTAGFPTLEADDVMGILATENDGCVIATMDKDLSQIPVPIYHLEEKKISLPEHRDCDGLFYKQVLMGDVTDGYYGCPGIGEGTAMGILKTLPVWEQYEHTFKSGNRKGQTELRWQQTFEDGRTVWQSIVSYYVKAGLTEADALAQARCAFILRLGYYSDCDNTVKLWEPKNAK
jgi:DNA polymerase-1